MRADQHVSSDPKVVRFAPSPTGALHIGGARTALYNWLAARGSGGRLVLRIEDTDRERSTPDNVEQILDALRWLELDWDGKPVSQFERRDRHAQAIARLVDSGHAYPDPATGEEVRAWKTAHGNRGYRGEPRDEPGAAIRLRIPDDGATRVDDLLRGEIAFPNEAQDDFVIARGDGTPLYNLAVAVDDAEMAITDVIRGDDHLSNTPKQVNVLAALGHDPPRYTHLPLLHGPDGKKLSKRHGAASVQELRDRGYLPAAVRNYLALLGWGTEDDTTLMSTGELLERFDVARVGTASAIFDERKLRWMNGRHMRELPLDAYTEAVASHLRRSGVTPGDGDRLRVACAIAQDKAQTLDEVWPLVRFLFEPPADDPAAREKFLTEEAEPLLREARGLLARCEPFEPAAIEAELSGLLERSGARPKELYQAIRVAITGTTVSPGIFDSVAALGRDETLARIDAALAAIPPEASRAGD
jgi:glutamyl-tRNA synthetase